MAFSLTCICWLFYFVCQLISLLLKKKGIIWQENSNICIDSCTALQKYVNKQILATFTFHLKKHRFFKTRNCIEIVKQVQYKALEPFGCNIINKFLVYINLKAWPFYLSYEIKNSSKLEGNHFSNINQFQRTIPIAALCTGERERSAHFTSHTLVASNQSSGSWEESNR